MIIKFDHVVTTIIESHNIKEMIIVESKGSFESHVTRNFENTEKSIERLLKSQVNLNDATQTSQKR